MLKTIGFVLLWLTGSATAVAVAWTGVSIVDDELIEPAPATNQVAAQANSDPAPSTTPEVSGPTTTLDTNPTATPAKTPEPSSGTVTPNETSEPATVTPGPPTTPTAPTTEPTTTPSSNPPPTTAPTTPPTTPSEPTPTTAAPATTSPPTTPATAPPTPTSAPAQTLTFNLVGGSTAVSFSASNVKVLWATPNPGFTVKIEPESPGLKVEFKAEHHESRVDAWWTGEPRHEIRERPDDD